MVKEQAPNLVFKPALLSSAIRCAHTQSAPILFDLSHNLAAWADKVGEQVRIAAAMVRDMRDCDRARERACRTVYHGGLHVIPKRTDATQSYLS